MVLVLHVYDAEGDVSALFRKADQIERAVRREPIFKTFLCGCDLTDEQLCQVNRYEDGERAPGPLLPGKLSYELRYEVTQEEADEITRKLRAQFPGWETSVGRGPSPC